MIGTDDATLAKAWAAGDLSAGGKLLHRHTSMLRKFFRTKVTLDEIGDLVQATFEGCVKGIKGYNGSATFETYLRRVAHHKLVDHYRRKKTMQKGLEGFRADRDAAAELSPGLSTLFAAKESGRLLVRGLQRLPLEQQVLLEHRFYEGLTAPALAELYECPVGTIHSRIRLARARLEAIISEVGTDPETTEGTLTDLDGWALRVRKDMDRENS